jgi:hypothetical protein
MSTAGKVAGTHQLSYTAISAGREVLMSQDTVKLVAGILCVILIGIIILRRKGKKKSEDEF